MSSASAAIHPEILQHLDGLLAISGNIMAELNERKPSVSHISKLYQDRALCLQQLDELLRHSAAGTDDSVIKEHALPRLDELAALDECIVARLNKLRDTKEQELNELRQETKSVKSYRKNTRNQSKSFFINNKGLKG